MENKKIFFTNDDAESEYTFKTNGFIPEVVIEYEKNFFQVCIYTLKRLSLSFKHKIQQEGYYSIVPGIVLVKEASKKCTIETLVNLPKWFFDGLRPKTVKELDAILADFRAPYNKKFSEWVQVYPE